MEIKKEKREEKLSPGINIQNFLYVTYTVSSGQCQKETHLFQDSFTSEHRLKESSNATADKTDY